MKTEYFTNCVAAFEGGGVRGAAYAGAYKAAFDAGIRFSRVAGSSAGSIAAALIAAGGTPEVIAAKLVKTDLSTLQKDVTDKDVPFRKSTFIASVLRRVPSGTGKKVGQIVCYSGIHNSSAVRQWVEETLRELLKPTGFRADRPVRFFDLKIPLYVVAADVLQKCPKVWSLDVTPEDSVALAVQASCALPFYFQAVASGQSIFVDGGVISNLPSHVFPRRQGHPGRFAEKTLAFRLKADPLTPRSQFEDFTDYAFGIADTLVSAATSIQQSLQEGVYTIEISTGDVESTDFDKMSTAKKNMLFENGVNAVKSFVAREREIVGQHKVTSLYEGFDERLLAYVFAISEAKNTIWFSDSSTYWLFFIFPIVAAASRRGVIIQLIAQAPPSRDYEDEPKRRNLLRSLGCDVIEVESLAFTGLIVDYPSSGSVAVITSGRGAVGHDFEYTAEQVKVYRSQDDLPVIRNLGSSLAKTIEDSKVSPKGSHFLEIVALPPAELFAGLRSVSQYAEATFEIVDIEINDTLRVSQTHVKEYKLLQIEKLIDDLADSGFDLFAPCRYTLRDGAYSVITPPILEMTSQGAVLIEGHTRAFYTAQLGRGRFRGVLVKNVHAPLPVEPRPFTELRIASGTMSVASILPSYDKSLIRQIEAALHP